jgi:glutamyl/glutaminyl-tRNA synthetase
MEFKKTRIAPTPSGYLHLGNILSFSLTAALAKKTGATILLRIDDLDRERVMPEYVQDIFDTLNYLELPWDEGPADAAEFFGEWSQVHRLGLYREALQRLSDSGAVFACTCSRSQVLHAGPGGAYPGTCRDRGLPLTMPDTSWRLRTPETVSLTYKSYPDGVIVTRLLPVSMRDPVVRKKDGFPAYQLTSPIDDLHFGIDLIVRGADLLASTLAQLYLSGVLGMPGLGDATFFHHALLRASSGEKLSKSAGDTSIRYLRGQGWKPAAIYGSIAARMGCSEPARDWKELAEQVLAMPG